MVLTAGYLDTIREYMNKVAVWLSIPDMKFPVDILEIFIIAFLTYSLLRWMKNTRAWSLLRGVVVLLIFLFLAYLLQMNVILWLAYRSLNVAVIAAIIVFQPELRNALERIGKQNYFSVLIPDLSKDSDERFSDRTLNELVKATLEMAKKKTGALIVLEQKISLADYERTGITLDSLVSTQLLLNIFEDKTPLHDGAIIVRGDRIVSATCYLPLSDNMALSKDLGTRHRAGVGISEVGDSLTIIVSEETGGISIALEGILYRNLDSDGLREKLVVAQNKPEDSKRFKLWGRSGSKGRLKDEETSDK